MRTLRFVSSLLLGFVVTCPLAAQSTATKDGAALTVLTQMAAANGWNGLSVPVDVLATGTVTRQKGGQQDILGIVFKVKGARKIRMELQEGFASRVTIVNSGRAVVLVQGDTQVLPSHVAAAQRSFEFPFLTDLVATGDENVSVLYLGTEAVRGELVHRIEIAREPPANFPAREYKRQADSLTVWVSAVTGLPIQVQFHRLAFDNPTAMLAVRRYLSDYRPVAGLLVPFRQEEVIEGELRYVFQLTSVDFNVGLSDFEFELPSGPR